MARSWVRFLLTTAFLTLGSSAAVAQNGTITGRVTDAETQEPLASARVDVLAAGTSVAGAFTDEDGRFSVTGVEPATYEVVVTMVGYREYRVGELDVQPGATATITALLRSQAFNLNPVVVTASRQREKALEAPATVAVVPERAIVERPTLTPVEHVRSIPGVDIITQGVQGTNVVARGFNNIFSTTLHTLTDYRMASIASLRANLLHFIPANNEDIERVEVVLGPGAALYGPNTAAGVLHMLTRSPLEHQGNVVSVAGGERSVLQGNFRTANKVGDNFGWKLSGQYLQGQEWPFTDPEEAAAFARAFPFDPDTKIGRRDYDIQRYGLDARADWRVTPDMTAVFSAGHTVAASGIEMTGVGAGQTVDWKYSYVQARASTGRLFGQVYMNMSDAGETYLLRNGLVVKDNSKFIVGQLQHGLSFGARQNFTYGTDLFFTRPDTEGRIHGKNEEADHTNEIGAYIQSETALNDRFDVVLAGRVDHHTRLDGLIFSPRAALVYKPVENQNFRLTYNRAFNTPVSFNLYLDLPIGSAPGLAGDLFGYKVRAMGTEPNGFTFIDENGVLAGIRSPFAEFIGRTDADLLTADVATLYKLGLGALQSIGRLTPQQAAALAQIPVQNIPINVLNPRTNAISRLSTQSVRNFERAEESLTSTIEAGYKGIIGTRFLLNADVWYEQRTNLTSPLAPITPLVLLDSAGVYANVFGGLRAGGMSEAEANATASAVAAGFKQIPVAVVSSTDVPAEGAELVASYFNAGELDLWGADLNATALLTDNWSVTGGVAIVSDNFFRVEGEFVGLNAPKDKGTLAINYRADEERYHAELRTRFTGEFPVYSAPYNATACVPGQEEFEIPLTGVPQPCVESNWLVDLTLGAKVPWVHGTSVQLTVQDILDTKYRTFVGVPTLGRFALLRVRHEF